jgi:preprotein translocase subunit SecA
LLERFEKQTADEKEQVLERGGLYVLGTERHESRRIDNQLRGRSGRQGDPGESRFYLSLEDDLMRLFASDRIASIMNRLRIPDDVPIEAKMVSKSIERAQTSVEQMNFEIRKNVLKYDEVMDKQRKVIYEKRRQILEGDDLHDETLEIVSDVVDSAVAEYANPEMHPEEWEWDQLFARVREIYPSRVDESAFDKETADPDEVVEAFHNDSMAYYEEREQEIGAEEMRRLERLVLLSVLDNRWREHLYEMDYLQEGIGLRAMGQKDPLVEYTREGFDMFQQLEANVKEDFARYMFHVEAVRREERAPTRMREERRQIPLAQAQPPPADVDEEFDEDRGHPPSGGEMPVVEQARSEKIPRNAPCPCGSGKKYKMCHGRPGAAAL